MKVLELLENDDWDVPAAPTTDEGKVKHMLNNVQSTKAQLDVLKKQRDALLAQHKPKNASMIDRIKQKIQKLESEHKIVIGKNKIPNPIGICNDVYVGPPAQYPDLTTTQVNLLNQIEVALSKNGKPPLAVLYGGRHPTHNGINFVAVNADLSFAWRKYDPSPGAGQNWVYIRGVGQMKTSDFVVNPKTYLKQMT